MFIRHVYFRRASIILFFHSMRFVSVDKLNYSRLIVMDFCSNIHIILKLVLIRDVSCLRCVYSDSCLFVGIFNYSVGIRYVFMTFWILLFLSSFFTLVDTPTFFSILGILCSIYLLS